jgi:hypothetical protein
MVLNNVYTGSILYFIIFIDFLREKNRYNQNSSYLQKGHQGLRGGAHGLLTASINVCTDYISPISFLLL